MIWLFNNETYIDIIRKVQRLNKRFEQREGVNSGLLISIDTDSESDNVEPIT
jgi:hypothetical protein